MRSPTSYDYMYADIKKQYINTYRDAVRKINFELPTIGLDKIGNSSSGGPMNVVVPWYLGEDILIVKKVNKGNI